MLQYICIRKKNKSFFTRLAVDTLTQRLPQLRQHNLVLYMLMCQRKELMTYLEECIVPTLRGQCDLLHLKALVKGMLSCNDSVDSDTSQVKLIRVALKIDQQSGSDSTLRWLLALMLQNCETEDEQDDVFTDVMLATSTFHEE